MEIKFDSNEEKHFSYWLNELKENKYIDSWEKIEISYQLTSGLINKHIIPMKRVDDKEVQQTILQPSSYTPDFKIIWNKKAYGIFVQEIGIGEKIKTKFICDSEGISIVETKADFDRNNMTRLANSNIKFMYEKYNIYVNLIKLPSLFNVTFTPKKYLLTDKTKQPRSIKYKNIRSLKEFV